MCIVDWRTGQKTRSQGVRERQERVWKVETAEEKRKLEKQEMFGRGEKERRV